MPKRRKPDAIALIKEDHREVEKLFDSFEKARDGDRKKALARELCTELTIHAMIEEEIFYPACQNKIEDEGVLDEAYVEQDGAKVLISEIISNINARFFEAKVTVLSEMIKHHVKEEGKRSEGLLAQAKAAGLDMAGRATGGAHGGVKGAVRRWSPAAGAHAQLHRPQSGSGLPPATPMD